MKNGRVIINRSICDNAPECSGIAVCPAGALYWNDLKDRIDYNEELCIDCGCCADREVGGCPIGAILWGADDEDYKKKKEAVEQETRQLSELEVERYGASPFDPIIEISDVNLYLNNSECEYNLLEFFNDDSINCLLHSIRVEDIKALFDNNADYQKVSVENVEQCKDFRVTDLPAIAMFRDKRFLGAISGYYDDNESQKFFDQIRRLADLS